MMVEGRGKFPASVNILSHKAGISMIRTSCIRAIVLALFLLVLGGVGRAQDLVITHAAVYSAPDAPVRKNMAVVIRHGVIAGVGQHLRIQTISCQVCVVLADFRNAHVHFMEPKWDDAANPPADQMT